MNCCLWWLNNISMLLFPLSPGCIVRHITWKRHIHAWYPLAQAASFKTHNPEDPVVVCYFSHTGQDGQVLLGLLTNLGLQAAITRMKG